MAPAVARQTFAPNWFVQTNPGEQAAAVQSAPKPTVPLCALTADGAISDVIRGIATIEARPAFLIASLRDTPLKGETRLLSFSTKPTTFN